MNISKRLIVTLSVSLGAMLVVGGLGLWQLNQAQQRMEYVAKNTFPSIREMVALHDANAEIRVAARNFMLASNDAGRAAAQAVISDSDKKFDASVADYLANNISNDTDRQLLDADKNGMAAYRVIRDKVLSMFQAGQRDAAVQLLASQGVPTAHALNKALTDHMEFNFKLANDLVDQSQQSYQQALWISIALIAAAFVIAGLLATQLFAIIRGGLSGMQNAMQHVNQTKDFTHRVPVKQMDEIGVTVTAFNQLIAVVHDSLKSIRNGAHEVAAASQEMSQAASQVSTASAAQSEASANMAATVEQMTVSINHVAERARETQDLTVESGKLVQDGSSIIGETIHDIREISSVVTASATSIRELEGYSGQVSSVINVIREIADQTNLLALNAAIEAARAGEQGRGFAVVADEVRKLAERTARSTQEISGTIETMVARSQQATGQMQSAEQLVNTGVQRADEADQAIKRIGETSSSAAHMVSEISAAITQQGVASNNIAGDVERTAQMSEESSAAAQSTADTANRLNSLAKGQIEVLSQFVL